MQSIHQAWSFFKLIFQTRFSCQHSRFVSTNFVFLFFEFIYSTFQCSLTLLPYMQTALWNSIQILELNQFKRHSQFIWAHLRPALSYWHSYASINIQCCCTGSQSTMWKQINAFKIVFQPTVFVGCGIREHIHVSKDAGVITGKAITPHPYDLSLRQWLANSAPPSAVCLRSVLLGIFYGLIWSNK